MVTSTPAQPPTPTYAPDTRLSTLRAALHYARSGWPVIPGAVWRDGHFADPAAGEPVPGPLVRPVGEATTDAALVREWWAAPGLYPPNVVTVTGPALGAFAVFDELAEAIVRHPWFAANPTPVLAIQEMPLAYFLVRPPMPAVLLDDNAHVLDAGIPMPLPPSAIGGTEVIWLVTPEATPDTLVAADDLADLIRHLERKSA